MKKPEMKNKKKRKKEYKPNFQDGLMIGMFLPSIIKIIDGISVKKLKCGLTKTSK